MAGLVHREADNAYLVADRVRGPEQARRVLVIAIAACQSRQTLDDIGQMQKSMGVRGDY